MRSVQNCVGTSDYTVRIHCWFFTTACHDEREKSKRKKKKEREKKKECQSAFAACDRQGRLARASHRPRAFMLKCSP